MSPLPTASKAPSASLPCPARGDSPPSPAPCSPLRLFTCSPRFPPTFWPQQGDESPAAEFRKQRHWFSAAHGCGHPPRRGRGERGVWRWLREAAAADGMCRAKWERGSILADAPAGTRTSTWFCPWWARGTRTAAARSWPRALTVAQPGARCPQEGAARRRSDTPLSTGKCPTDIPKIPSLAAESAAGIRDRRGQVGIEETRWGTAGSVLRAQPGHWGHRAGRIHTQDIL